MPGQVDALYTREDHAFRENDPYARAKYELTLRWLAGRTVQGELLYNVGVGSGYFNHLAVSAGLRVVGCEPDPAAYAAATATAPARCELVHCGLEQFAQGRPAARLVVMHDVLEHIEDEASAVRALRALVTPAGTAIVSVPALMSLYGRHDEDLGHFRRYTPRTLRKALEPEFVFEKLQWYGMMSIPIAWYFSRLRRAPYPLSTARSVAGTVYGALCSIESFLPEPVGTSLIARLTPRA